MGNSYHMARFASLVYYASLPRLTKLGCYVHLARLRVPVDFDIMTRLVCCGCLRQFAAFALTGFLVDRDSLNSSSFLVTHGTLY